MRIRYPIVLILGLMIAAQSNAAGFLENQAIRGGASVGRLSLDDENISFKEHSTSWDVFVGYEFNRYLAVEAGRLNGGTPTQTIENGGVFDNEVENSSWHASAIGSWPFNDIASVYVRGGISSWHSKLNLSLNNVVYSSASDSGTAPVYGFGFGINIDSGQVRVEYDLSQIKIPNGAVTETMDLSQWSLGIIWRFRL
jgi:opacity protein-like surface antigen